MIKLLSQGEIEKGMYVAVYETLQEKQSFNMSTGEITTVITPIKNTNIQGIPYRVLDKAGPIIEVLFCGVTGMGLGFIDSRIARFLEVEENYFINYAIRLGVTPTAVQLIINKEKPVKISEQNEFIS